MEEFYNFKYINVCGNSLVKLSALEVEAFNKLKAKVYRLGTDSVTKLMRYLIIYEKENHVLLGEE